MDRTTIVDMLTSNGLQFSRDTAARVRAIRLDAKRPDPENRTFGFHPVTEATENRAKYLRAAVALVHHWLKAGAHMQSDASDFGQWKNIVGGILEVAGVPGFEDETLMPVSDRVADGGEAEFVSAWWHAAEDKLVEATALVDLAYGDEAGQGGTMDPPTADRKAWARSLSKRLGSMAGRYYTAGGTAVRLDAIPPDRQAGKPARFRLSASGNTPGNSQNSQNSQNNVSRAQESNPPGVTNLMWEPGMSLRVLRVLRVVRAARRSTPQLATPVRPAPRRGWSTARCTGSRCQVRAVTVGSGTAARKPRPSRRRC